MVIEFRVMQFRSEIILVNTFEIPRMISDQIALHSVQLPLLYIAMENKSGNMTMRKLL